MADISFERSKLEIHLLRHYLTDELSKLNISSIENDPIHSQSSDELNKYVSLASQLTLMIIDGDYEQVIQKGHDLQFFELSSVESKNLDEVIHHNVLSFTQTAESNEYRQFIVLCVGIACLELFVQNNWFGCPTKTTPGEHLGKHFLDQEQNKTLDYTQNDLVLDGDVFCNSAKHALYLYMARTILMGCHSHLAGCLSADVWLLRYVLVHQAMLAERSPILKAAAMELIEKLSKNEQLMASDTYSDLALEFHIEAGHLCFFYYEPRQAKQHFDQAEKLCALNIKLTGELGKRTRFQQKDVSQLILAVTRSEADQPWAPPVTTSPILPKNVSLSDDTVLDQVQLSAAEQELVVQMSALQQATVLGLCYKHRRSKEISPIVQEECEAFVNAVLKEPQAWAVQTKALLLRSQWEWNNHRKMQRAMPQLEELVAQYQRPEPGAGHRLYMFYALSLPPIWEIQCELAALFEKVGATHAALEVYLRIEAWEEVIKCYAQLGKIEKADKLIREQLAIKENPLLWCYLGDIHNDEQYYFKSWELSNGRFGRAQRSLAALYIHQKKVEMALSCFEKSLQINGLQLGVWFSYGCAALQVEKYDLAAKAFRKCVNLEDDNFEAWSNLATAYIKSKQKTRAFAVLHEAIRCEFENWMLWENYLLVGVDIGQFGEVMQAYHRLLDLREKHTDVEVLAVLVRAIRENVEDALGQPSITHRPKALTLFGRITSKITSDAAIWRLYAELTSASQEELSLEDQEKTLRFLQKSQRCATQAVNWEKDVTKCTEVLQQSCNLVQVYMDFVKKLQDEAEAKKLLFAARLMAKGVLTKVQKSQIDLTGNLLEQLNEPCSQLQDQIILLTQALEEYT